MHHAEELLGVPAGGTTPDGLITVEHAECQAACTEAPCLQVNYRYRYRVTPDDLDALFDDLRAGRLDEEIPPHGTLARVRQRIPSDRGVGAVPPERSPGRRPGSHRRAEGAAQKSSGTADPHAPGFIAGDRPEIVTARFKYDDSHTLERFLPPAATRASRRRWPSRRRPSTTTSARRPCSGRGGAGFPAGLEVGPHPPGRVAALPRRQRRRERARHVQGPAPHGARPAPAHRGLPHRVLRGRAVAVLPLHPRRDGPGPGTGRRRRSTRPTPPATSARTSSAPTSPSTSSCSGAPAPTSSARRRRSSRASRATGACRG